MMQISLISKRLMPYFWTAAIISCISFQLFGCGARQAYRDFRDNTYARMTQEGQPASPAPSKSQSGGSTSSNSAAQKRGEASSGSLAAAPIPSFSNPENDEIVYHSQAGDTLLSVAARFGVKPEQIKSPDALQTPGLLDPGLELHIPGHVLNLPFSQPILPDSEVVDSPSTVDFDISAYIQQAGGYLAHSRQYTTSGMTDGAGIVQRVARETSFNPRLLLAIMEYHCNCVLEEPGKSFNELYPLGFEFRQGLYHQLVWAVDQLSDGYYGWRSGTLTQLVLPGGDTIRLAPDLNAGTVALQYYFAQYDIAQKETRQTWEQTVGLENGFSGTYVKMFGKPWARAARVEPLLPAGLSQPELQLPFLSGTIWSYTGGPHYAWEHTGPFCAVDFAPQSAKTGCNPSDEWVAAAADGLIVRAEGHAVVLDLDGDGYEQTGWVLVYFHVIFDGTIQSGDRVKAGDKLGHPTCEEDPSLSTGTHVHIARKYNGEWMSARDSVKYILDGWVVHAGAQAYKGTLTKEGQTAVANPFGPSSSWITRPEDIKRPHSIDY